MCGGCGVCLFGGRGGDGWFDGVLNDFFGGFLGGWLWFVGLFFWLCIGCDGK